MKPHILAYVLMLFALFAGSLPARAALDPEMKKPYQLQVVLQIGSNRVFTPLFQEQLQRDVRNHLQIRFGKLAHIEVTRSHPLLRDIETKSLDAALEAWDSISEHTTHFVLLDYSAGMYQIATRFHDGRTGQAGAVTQRIRTSDRAEVSTTITRLIEESFSPVGTVTAVGKTITLKLQGGELGVPMDRWVQRGNVFAVSRIIEANGRPRGVRLEWALLEALDAPINGVCSCRYLHRYQEDRLQETPGTLGFRALQLPTVKGLVKVQLLDDTTLQPLDAVRVRVKSPDDSVKPVEAITNRDGIAITRESFAHLALVQVLSGETVRAQFPVELIAGRTIVARVKLQTDRESLVPLEARRDAWLGRVYDNVRMSSERTLELSGQLNQSLEAALESGRRSLPLLETEVKYLDREHEELGRLAKEKNLAYNLREGEQQIDELRKQMTELKAFVQRLDGVLKESAGSEKDLGLHKLLERARLLEAEAEYDRAIRLYEQVMQASPEQGKIKAHLDQLKASWTPKGEKHSQARAFIYEIWPTLDVASLQKNLPLATDALATCREAGDKLTLQKLLRVNVTHTVNLKKQLETLKRRDSEDNRNQAKIVAQISESLLRLHNDAVTFLGKRKE